MSARPDLARLRLAALRIAGDGFRTATDAVRWLTCVQAQDLPGALTSVALRVEGGTRADVVAALDAGEIVRSWPMRGTLHLTAAEDIGWMAAAATPRVVARTERRRHQLGLEPADGERARELTVAALTGGGRMTRAELLETWDAAGLSTGGQRGAHLLGLLAMTGTVCLGPMRGSEQLVVLHDEWVPAARHPERDEALAEWADRYFRSHGPASVADFTRWTGLPAADARAGVAAARADLAELVVDGTTYLMDPATPERLAGCRRAAGGTFLLPGFDEYVLGYGDRSAIVDAENADRIVPGGNGMFRATVVHKGRIVGTWRRSRTGDVDATPFTTFGTAVDRALPRLAAEHRRISG